MVTHPNCAHEIDIEHCHGDEGNDANEDEDEVGMKDRSVQRLATKLRHSMANVG